MQNKDDVFVKNVGDKNQVRNARERVKRKEAKERADVLKVLSLPEGRRFFVAIIG